MESKQYTLLQPQDVAYYEDTQERTLIQKIVKVKNTLLQLLAYICPNNGIRKCLHRLRGVHIGKNVYLGMFCFFDNLHPEYIYIEDNASINAGTMILTHFNPMKRYSPILQAQVLPVLIKEGAIVAVRSTILPGVIIGQSAIVSAGSVVDKSVADYTMVRGNPAKKVVEYEILVNTQKTNSYGT